MLGYSYRARYLDEEILGRLENKPTPHELTRRISSTGDAARSLETSGYPDWPENLVGRG